MNYKKITLKGILSVNSAIFISLSGTLWQKILNAWRKYKVLRRETADLGLGVVGWKTEILLRTCFCVWQFSA